MTRKQQRRVGYAIYYLVAGAIALTFVAPMVWSLIASVTGARATGGSGVIGFDNYRRLIQFGEGLDRYLFNSVVVAVVAVIGTLLVTVPGGYAFARFRFPGKNVLFIAALAILMIPHPTILVPLYTLLGWVGGQNSLSMVGMILVMFQLPFGLFLMRNAFEGLPKELEEAALIDGCTTFGALRRVLLPAVRPSMVTVAMFAFLASWNEFMTPLILLAEGSKFTLPVALVTLRTGEMGAMDMGALMAGIVITAIPCVVLFVGLQKQYVRGFTSGALKG